MSSPKTLEEAESIAGVRTLGPDNSLVPLIYICAIDPATCQENILRWCAEIEAEFSILMYSESDDFAIGLGLHYDDAQSAQSLLSWLKSRTGYRYIPYNVDKESDVVYQERVSS